MVPFCQYFRSHNIYNSLPLEIRKLFRSTQKKHSMKNPYHPQSSDEELAHAFLNVFTEILETLKENRSMETEYYDSADVKRLLNISDSTLFRIRKAQLIPHIKIGKKIFYPKSFFKNTFRK